MTLQGGIQLTETRRDGEVLRRGNDASEHGSVLLAWGFYNTLHLEIEWCASEHHHLLPILEEQSRRIWEFVKANSVDREPELGILAGRRFACLRELLTVMSQRDREFSCGLQRKYGALGLMAEHPQMCEDFAKDACLRNHMTAEGIREATDKLLSVPRIPVYDDRPSPYFLAPLWGAHCR